MIVAGIDVGGQNVHMVLMDNGVIIGKGWAPTGIKKAEAVEKLYEDVLKAAGLSRSNIERIVATGSSAKRVAFADGVIPDAAADARAVSRLVPSGKTVIDVGAEKGRAIKVDSEGRVLDFALNEKCAAGTGTFVEAISRALEMSVQEMAKVSLQSQQAPSINAQCAVFGESEVVSLIHQKVKKPDIARAVHDAIAGRVASLARIVGAENDVVVVGGMALNDGFVDSLKRILQMDIIVPNDPDYAGAIGAASAGTSEVTVETVKGRGDRERRSC